MHTIICDPTRGEAGENRRYDLIKGLFFASTLTHHSRGFGTEECESPRRFETMESVGRRWPAITATA
eukprot:3074962-Pyramimonas_sp.AAC.1